MTADLAAIFFNIYIEKTTHSPVVNVLKCCISLFIHVSKCHLDVINKKNYIVNGILCAGYWTNRKKWLICTNLMNISMAKMTFDHRKLVCDAVW